MNTKVFIDNTDEYAVLKCRRITDTTHIKVIITCYDNSLGEIIIDGGTFSDERTSVNGGYDGYIDVTGQDFTLTFTKPENISGLGNWGNLYWTALFKEYNVVQAAQIVNASEIEKFINVKILNIQRFETEKPFNLNNLPKLENINFHNRDFKYGYRVHLPNLKHAYIQNCSRLIMDYQDCPNLTQIEKVTGLYPHQDISNFNCADTLEMFTNSNSAVGSSLYGDISHFSTFSKLKALSLGNSYVYGDITTLPSQITKFSAEYSFDLDFSNVNGDKILDSISVWDTRGIRLTTSEIDNLLISISKSTLTADSEIYLKGNRSSASDDAVATINAVTEHLNIQTI